MLSGYRRLDPGLGAVEGGVSLTTLPGPGDGRLTVPRQEWVLRWSPEGWPTWVTRRMTASEAPPGRPASTGPRRQAGGETGGPGQVYVVQSSAHTNVEVRLPEHSGVGGEGLLSAPGPREALCRRPVSWP